MKFFATNGHRHLNTNAISMAIQSHNQNKYYRIHHRNIGKCYKNIKNTSHNHCQCLLLYKLAEQSTSGLGRFLECWKCNILVIRQALMLYLKYTHSPSGTAHPQASCVYIRQSTLSCVITYAYSQLLK